MENFKSTLQTATYAVTDQIDNSKITVTGSYTLSGEGILANLNLSAIEDNQAIGALAIHGGIDGLKNFGIPAGSDLKTVTDVLLATYDKVVAEITKRQ